MTNNTNLRLPAEWERQESVLMAWPHRATDWAYMLGQVQECYITIISAIRRYATVILIAPAEEGARIATLFPDDARLQPVKIVHIPNNDTWARDFGVICTECGGMIQANDFKFNGWGLKFAADKDNLINRRLLEAAAAEAGISHTLSAASYANRLGFVLEGGSIESDGRGTMLTTSECLLSPNRNGDLDRADIEGRLREYLGAEKVLWLEHGYLEGDDTDSHIDTLARLAPDNAILYSSCDRADDVHYAGLKAMEAELSALTDAGGRPYTLYPLPIPMPIYDADGQRLPATYANFLIINGAVIMPVYADEHYDSVAIDTVGRAFPGYSVVPVDCRALIQQHGSLHCVTMQVPCL